MVIDKIENLEKYVCLNDKFKKVFEFIKNQTYENKSPGKYEIDGKNSYLSLNIMQTRESADWEIHHKYWDIHIVLKGQENFGWSSGEGFSEETVYDPEKDIAFYSSDGEYVTLTPGYFIMIAPGEMHKPAMMLEQVSSITKIVIKVLGK